MRTKVISVLCLIAGVIAYPQYDRQKSQYYVITPAGADSDNLDSSVISDSDTGVTTEYYTESNLNDETSTGSERVGSSTTEGSETEEPTTLDTLVTDTVDPSNLNVSNGNIEIRFVESTTSEPPQYEEDVQETVSGKQDEEDQRYSESKIESPIIPSTLPFETLLGTQASYAVHEPTEPYHAKHTILKTSTIDMENEINYSKEKLTYPSNNKSQITSRFYFYEAPQDESSEEVAIKQLSLGRPRKNFKIVFIMAPEPNPFENISISVAPREERTAVYVLTKEEDDVMVEIATPPPTTPSPPEVHFVKYDTSEEVLKFQEKVKGGWTLLHNGKSLDMWDYRQALTRIQPIHGAYPFFKVSVGHLNTPPYYPIITLTEGEVGLPHKVYYSLANNNEILDAYKMLLRDFAINMGIVGVEAEQFADEVFHYEKRIVTKILAVENSEYRRLNQIMTLGEISKSIPLLPIFETVQATFPNTKITENTRILVQDVGVIEAMSRIITSSDVPLFHFYGTSPSQVDTVNCQQYRLRKATRSSRNEFVWNRIKDKETVLNNFIVWSLARRFLPFMSREYRLPMEKFETFLYGNKTATPQWFFCSKIVRDWMPFAVDTLRQNPNLLKVPTRRYGFYDEPKNYHLVDHPIDLNSELAKLIFFHIRNTLQEALEHASWMNDDHRKAIIEKLSTISFQIGIPESVLETNEYANEYYEHFVLQNLFFVENLESLRRLEKSRMEKRLKKLHAIDAIIAELYPGYGERAKSTGYLPDFNIAIISKKLAEEPYFDYRYPVALNFARLGVVVADLLIKSVTPYAIENSNDTFVFGENPECVSDYIIEKPLPNFAIKNIFSQLSSTHVAFKALSSFLDLVESSEPVVGAPLTEGANYENLHLINKKLQPGLRAYDDKKLFILGSMQTHCSVSFEAYKKFKPYVEGQIAESELFRLIWTQVPHTSQEMSCSEGSRTCSDIL